jgi:hypothetical protein
MERMSFFEESGQQRFPANKGDFSSVGLYLTLQMINQGKPSGLISHIDLWSKSVKFNVLFR